MSDLGLRELKWLVQCHTEARLVCPFSQMLLLLGSQLSPRKEGSSLHPGGQAELEEKEVFCPFSRASVPHLVL